jgi:hypothetical protein
VGGKRLVVVRASLRSGQKNPKISRKFLFGTNGWKSRDSKNLWSVLIDDGSHSLVDADAG